MMTNRAVRTTAAPCPRCNTYLVTNGHVLWCPNVRGNGCNYGVDRRILLPAMLPKPRAEVMRCA